MKKFKKIYKQTLFFLTIEFILKFSTQQHKWRCYRFDSFSSVVPQTDSFMFICMLLELGNVK